MKGKIIDTNCFQSLIDVYNVPPNMINKLEDCNCDSLKDENKELKSRNEKACTEIFKIGKEEKNIQAENEELQERYDNLKIAYDDKWAECEELKESLRLLDLFASDEMKMTYDKSAKLFCRVAKLEKALKYYADVLRPRCRMKEHDNGKTAIEALKEVNETKNQSN